MDLAAVAGPYGALVLALGVIGWLVKDRARVQLGADTAVGAANARATAAEAARDAALTRGDVLYDRLVDNGERLIPIVEKVGPVLEATTRALDRAREASR